MVDYSISNVSYLHLSCLYFLISHVLYFLISITHFPFSRTKTCRFEVSCSSRLQYGFLKVLYMSKQHSQNNGNMDDDIRLLCFKHFHEVLNKPRTSLTYFFLSSKIGCYYFTRLSQMSVQGKWPWKIFGFGATPMLLRDYSSRFWRYPGTICGTKQKTRIGCM